MKPSAPSTQLRKVVFGSALKNAARVFIILVFAALETPAYSAVLVADDFNGYTNIQSNQASVILDDTWADGTRTNENMPTQSAWFVNTSNNPPIGAQPGSLFLTNSSSTSRVFWTYFTANSPVNLSDGQTLKVTLVFIPHNVVTTSLASLRFGLLDYESGAEGRVLSDDSAISTSGTNVMGYMMWVNFSQTFIRYNPTYGFDSPMTLFVRYILDGLVESGDPLGKVTIYDTLGYGPIGMSNAPGFISGTTYTLEFSVANVNGSSVITTKYFGDGLNISTTATDSDINYHRFDTFMMRDNRSTETADSFECKEFKVELLGNDQPPSITTQPVSVFRRTGENATFSVTANGQPPLRYQWHNGTGILANATNSSLTITNAQADASYYVVVSNSYGSVTSITAYLKLLGVDTGLACYLPTVTPLPPKQPGKNNLVVVTHGWESSGTNANVSWITNLCDTIRSNAPGDWQVVPYTWLDKANGVNTVYDTFLLNFVKQADNALHNAEDIGTQIGRQIAEQGWSHVHLIGHSAGAGLIQKAAEAIYQNAPGIVVHTTFLDPFLGRDKHGLSEYGTNADWSDSYFDRDLITGSYTEGRLPNAYNADVTWTESAPDITPVIYAGTQPAGCYAMSPLPDSHSYPHDFYHETVLGTQKSCAVGLGFSLSKEGGGWNNHASYTNGGFSSPCEECPGSLLMFNESPLINNSQVNLGLSPYATSPTGAALFDDRAFILTSGSPPLPLAHKNPGGVEVHPLDAGGTSTNSTGTPSWLAVGLTITNAVNFVQFDAVFTDTNAAEGLLTVYWDTNQIGTVDERVVSPGLAMHRFFLPETVTNSVYVLGFRLDAFNDTSPSITITNVATGFAGVTQPLTLGITLTNNTPILQLTGASNYNYLVESSTNLVDWTPTALLVNTNGTAQFIDSAVTNSGARFYRAISP